MLMIVLSQFGMKFGKKKLIDLKTISTILTYFNFKQKCYSFRMGIIDYVVTPLWPSVGGEAQHFQSWGFGVLWNSRMFRVRQQGPKHLALRCSWCHWKGLEA